MPCSLQEALKAKKLGRDLEPPRPGQPPHTKRYLILTYVVEFDRVHYPLPLAMEDTPTIASQARHIRRLKRELTAARSSVGGSRTTPGSVQAPTGGGTEQTVSELQAQLQDTRTAVAAGEEALEKLRTASRAEVKRLRAEVATLTTALEDATRRHGALSAEAKQVAGTMAREAEAVMQLRDTNEQLRAKVQDLTRQLALAQSNSTSGRGGAGGGATGRQAGPRTPTGTPTARGRPVARTPGSTGSRASSVGSAGSSRGPVPARRTPAGLSVTAGSSSSSSTTAAGAAARRSLTPTARTPNGRQSSPVPPPPAKSRTPSSAQARETSARAAYGTPYTLPAQGGKSNSRGSTPNSTPGRASARSSGAASYLGSNPGRASAAVPTPSSAGSRQGQGPGVSPATARIYGQAPGRARASVSPAGSRGHASAGTGSASMSVGPATGSHAVMARTYLGGVEPILAGIDAQIAGKGLNKMHQASPGRGKSSPGPPKRVPISASAYAPASTRSAGQGLAVTGSGATNRAAASQTQRPVLAEPSAPPVPSPSSGEGRYDASKDIGDIDARLAQLQEFLRAAKAGQPLPDLPVARS